jgi:hypothetical protein
MSWWWGMPQQGQWWLLYLVIITICNHIRYIMTPDYLYEGLLTSWTKMGLPGQKCLESGQIDPDGVSGSFKCPDKVPGCWAVGPGLVGGKDQVSAIT